MRCGILMIFLLLPIYLNRLPYFCDMDFLPSDIQQYSSDHTSPSSELLIRLERETHLEVLKPRMLSGHMQGRLLSMISHMICPDRILEIGTYTGYSALCLAEGLSSNGLLYTIEYNEELIPRIHKYFEESPFAANLKAIHGKALEIIPTLNETWDLIFIDADKDNYTEYYNLVIPCLRKGGVILIDNVLWSGKVADTSHSDKKTEMMRSFNRMIQEDVRVENLLLPFRDGLTILRKL